MKFLVACRYPFQSTMTKIFYNIIFWRHTSYISNSHWYCFVTFPYIILFYQSSWLLIRFYLQNSMYWKYFSVSVTILRAGLSKKFCKSEFFCQEGFTFGTVCHCMLLFCINFDVSVMFLVRCLMSGIKDLLSLYITGLSQRFQVAR